MNSEGSNLHCVDRFFKLINLVLFGYLLDRKLALSVQVYQEGNKLIRRIYQLCTDVRNERQRLASRG